MTRNNHDYAKRQRDLRKQRKTEDKRARRLERKESAQTNQGQDGEGTASELPREANE